MILTPTLLTLAYQIRNLTLLRALVILVFLAALFPQLLRAERCENLFLNHTTQYANLLWQISTKEPPRLPHQDFGQSILSAKATNTYDLMLHSYHSWLETNPQNPMAFPLPATLQRPAREMILNYLSDLKSVRTTITPEYLKAFLWQMTSMKKMFSLEGEVPKPERVVFEVEDAIQKLTQLLESSLMTYEALINSTFEYSFLMQLITTNSQIKIIDVFEIPVWTRAHLDPHFATPARLLNTYQNGSPGFYFPAFTEVSKKQILEFGGAGLYVLGLTRKAAYVDALYLNSYLFTYHDGLHTGGQFIHGDILTGAMSKHNLGDKALRNYQNAVFAKILQIPEPYPTILINILFQINHEKSVPFDRESLKKVVVGSQSFRPIQQFFEFAIAAEKEGIGLFQVHHPTIEILSHPQGKEYVLRLLKHVLDLSHEPLLSDDDMQP